MRKIIALFLTLVILVCFSACSKSENDTSSSIETVIDSGTVSADNKYNVSKYASISSKELIEMLGQPSSVDNGYGKGFCDIPCVYYNYDNHETFGSLSFAIINDSVVKLSSYKTYDYKESDLTDTEGLLKYFGIEKQENCETIVQNELAHRYRCPSQNIDDFYIGLIGQAKDDSFGILEVTYDMSYYEEWYLPYEYDEWTGYKAQAEATIKSMLHSPDSAKFPYDSWDFAKNDYYFKVVGKVNADNLFGATLTYDFTFIYDNAGKCVYALFGDEEVNDGYKATKEILKATFDQTKHNQSLNETNINANKVDNPNENDDTSKTPSSNNEIDTDQNNNQQPESEMGETDDTEYTYTGDTQVWTETDLPITLKNDTGEIIIKNITFYADYNDDGSSFLFITFWSDKTSQGDFRISYSLVGENSGSIVNYNATVSEYGSDGENGNYIFSVDHDPITHDNYTIKFDDAI